jgi:signal transduction histidine kinase
VSAQHQAGIDRDADIREWLARELHDAVSSQLTTMLVEMELLRRQAGTPTEVEAFQRDIRKVLMTLRRLLHELRRQTPPDMATAAAALERKVATAVRWTDPEGGGG